MLRMVLAISVVCALVACGGEAPEGGSEGGEPTFVEGDPLAEAKTALAAHRWSKARELAEGVLEIRPELEEARKLAARARREQDNQSRVIQSKALFESRAYLEAYDKLRPIGEDSVYLDRSMEDSRRIRHALNLPESTLRKGGMTMRLVIIGAFRRGSSSKGIKFAQSLCRETSPQADCKTSDWKDERRKKDDKYRGAVFLDSFYIDAMEVSQAQYEACVEAGGCKPAGWQDCDLVQKSIDMLRDPEHPQVCVTWTEAEAYCTWAGARLPTEAEWEKAAGGPDESVFPWGNTWNETAANWGHPKTDGYERLAPVDAFQPNGYGLYNMAGNAHEWVGDWYTEAYYQESPALRPKGPEKGKHKVMRGGSFERSPVALRVTARNKWVPEARAQTVGFRCAAGVFRKPISITEQGK